MNVSLQQYGSRKGNEWLLEEFCAEKNRPLTPTDLTPYSKRLVWWQCKKGHLWAASPKCRTRECPICASERRKRAPNLSNTYPALAAQWHPTKNAPLKPEDLPLNSVQRVWWQCERGHSWRAAVSARIAGQGSCPLCSGRKAVAGVNDLATLMPELAAEWSQQNRMLTPADVTPESRKRVWWDCPKGHTWRCAVADRVSGRSVCPRCSGRVLTEPKQEVSTGAISR